MSSIHIVTNKPVAFDSPDHIQPWGTIRDNNRNWAFNRRLFLWIPASELRVLDLGCSGGGFVKSIHDQGGFAVGVEGSDYSKIRKRAEWATIPDHLFTADITEPFQFLDVDESGREHPIQFSVITAWEVMEHIREDKLCNVFQNISRHLSPLGVVIMSLSQNEEIIQGVRLHQTVQNRHWWISKCSQFGFVHHEQVLTYFGNNWVRGGDNAPGSFHLIMTRSTESLPFENRLRSLMYIVPSINQSQQLLNQARRTLSLVTPSPVKRAYRRIRDGQPRPSSNSRLL